MTDFFSLLLSTLMLRPYVFALFAFHIVVGSLQLGLKKIIVFTALGYFIAFLSEFTSTRIGIPYGYYYYIEATRDKELWISNVPLMDSLSYTFLAYFSYSLALLFRLPIVWRGYDVQLADNTDEIRRSGSVLTLSVILFVLQDVIADPLALRGSRWFLGQIYGYPYEGLYFGVPLANFLGWTVVGLVIFSIFRALDGLFEDSQKHSPLSFTLPLEGGGWGWSLQATNRTGALFLHHAFQCNCNILYRRVSSWSYRTFNFRHFIMAGWLQIG